jgi:hypothetical protein
MALLFPHKATGGRAPLRASIISDEEPATSDVWERESRREKKADDSRRAGKKQAK